MIHALANEKQEKTNLTILHELIFLNILFRIFRGIKFIAGPGSIRLAEVDCSSRLPRNSRVVETCNRVNYCPSIFSMSPRKQSVDNFNFVSKIIFSFVLLFPH